MQKQFIKITAAMLFCIFLFPVTVFAESARQLIRSGNNAYMAGDYEKSLGEYDKAAGAEPDSPIILFNRGNALYKQEAYDEAIKAFEQAAVQSLQDDDRKLEAKSRFNIGNSAYRKAEILRSTDLQKALDIYGQSAENYQAALQINPELVDAGYNLEMARRTANQVLSEIKKQEKQEQQQKQAREQLSKELSELLEEQQDAAQKSSELAASRQQGAASDNGRKSEKLAEEQQAIKNKTAELANKSAQLSAQQSKQPSGAKARQHLDRAIREQQQAEDKLNKNMPEQARQNQEKAAAEMFQARDALNRQEEQQEEQQPQQGQSRDQQENSQPQTVSAEADNQKKEAEEQASQVAPPEQRAQDILNEEAENRKIRQGRSVTGYQPVEKDW